MAAGAVRGVVGAEAAGGGAAAGALWAFANWDVARPTASTAAEIESQRAHTVGMLKISRVVIALHRRL